MKIKVIDTDGAEREAIEWSDELIVRDRGEQAVHDAVVATLAARRRGTAAAKSRGQVRASGRKLWRQKGTGRARQGTISAPHWRGGGAAFGPKPRDYTQHLPKKVRRLAFRRALSERIAGEALTVVESLELAEPKTRLLLERMRGLSLEAPLLIVVAERERNLVLAARNLPGVEVVRARDVDTYRLLRYPRILGTREAVEILRERAASSAGSSRAAEGVSQ